MEFLGENSVPFYIVFTKADKLKLSELNRNIQVYKKVMTKSNWESMPPHFVTSAVDTTGKDELLNLIDELNQQVATQS
jgi:GTP-binding protein